MSFTCPRCGLTSYHPRDIADGYCGNCHDWTSRPAPPPYPFCRTPELCAGKGYCPKEIACNN
jgi:hypothetical protein